MLNVFLKTIMAAFYQVKARSYLDSGDYSKSLLYVEKFGNSLGKKNVHILLIEGNVYFRERKYEKSIDVMLSVIEKLKNNRRLKYDDKKYLMAHATYLINFSIAHGDSNRSLLKVDLDFDSDKVKSLYKDQYTVFMDNDSYDKSSRVSS